MKTLNFGIFAHIDAGKTTLAERLLFEAGAIRTLGSVDEGTGFTDFLEAERRRGVSVRDATVSFDYRGVRFNMIDAPGHSDFREETELALAAADVAVLVISAREGVEAQTELLLDEIARRRLPAVIFVNKCDLGGDPRKIARAVSVRRELFEPYAPDAAEREIEALGNEELLDRFLAGTLPETELKDALTRACSSGRISPLLSGSAKSGQGVKELLDSLLAFFDFPRAENAPFSAFVYQVEHRKNVGKTAYVRVFSGHIGVRDEVYNRRTGSVFKAAQIKRVRADKYLDETELSGGDAGAIAGLADVRAGDLLGAEPAVPPPPVSEPYLRVRVSPAKEEELPALLRALGELCDESPSLGLEWTPEKRELTVSVSGKLQTEILAETLEERYGLKTEIGAPSVIYRETPARAAYGFEAYTMPKPCWAVVKFLIEPLPRGSGLVYESVASEKRIAYRYQEHVKTEVPRTLSQGLYGWQVTDLKVTLVDGEHHVQHTHPLDFFVATPMGLMDGLRNAGVVLLEPILALEVRGPENVLGKTLAELAPRRTKLGAPAVEGGEFALSCEIPAAETFDLGEKLASASGGRAKWSTRLLGYFPCPEGFLAVRERIGIDPLDRAKWILHARGAL